MTNDPARPSVTVPLELQVRFAEQREPLPPPPVSKERLQQPEPEPEPEPELEPDPAEDLSAKRAARAAEAERERLLELLEAMHPARSALVLRQAHERRDPFLETLGFEVAGASEDALHQQLLDELSAGTDGIVAALGELFKDVVADFEYDEDEDEDEDDEDQHQDEDAWIRQRNGA